MPTGPDRDPAPHVGAEVDTAGMVRRVRRLADLSQRELADRLAVSKSTVAAIESGARGIDAALLGRAAGLAGLRLALLDETGNEIQGMDPDAVRDRGGRRFPAHLDTVLSEERIDRWEHRPLLRRPTYTFDRRSPWADRQAPGRDRPDDHLLPQPGDSPGERAAARRAEQVRRSREELERRFLAGELRASGDVLTCTCPPSCDELEDWSGRPLHVDRCPCRCDIG